ncbi:MAG: trypsin-like peptidase domain-containing protein [Zetaproteobacteria bacterium]|nr:trypsin-like peptidase domain-containing protein [Zetaproteobacteria bacterium]
MKQRIFLGICFWVAGSFSLVAQASVLTTKLALVLGLSLASWVHGLPFSAPQASDCKLFCPQLTQEGGLACCEKADIFYSIDTVRDSRQVEVEAMLPEVTSQSSGVTPSGVINQDDRRPANVSSFPISAIGRVVVDFGSVNQLCTGALVGPNFMLTNMHCVTREGRVSDPGEIRFSPAYDDGSEDSAKGKYLIVPEDFDEARFMNDWALVVLDKRLADVYGSFGVENLERYDYQKRGGLRDEPVNLVGYSRDIYDSRPGGHFGCRIVGTTLTDQRGFYRVRHDCDSTKGSSGSPLYQFEGGEARLVALHNAGSPRLNFAVPNEYFARALQDALRNDKFRVPPFKRDRGACLAADAQVLDANFQPVAVLALQQNDALLGPQGSTHYFHSLSHLEKEGLHKFVRFETESGYQLVVSPDHVVYVQQGEQVQALRAKDAMTKMEEGDIRLPMLAPEQQQVVWHSVHAAREVVRQVGIVSFVPSVTPVEGQKGATYQAGRMGIYVLGGKAGDLNSFLVSPGTLPNEQLYYVAFNWMKSLKMLEPDARGDIKPAGMQKPFACFLDYLAARLAAPAAIML